MPRVMNLTLFLPDLMITITLVGSEDEIVPGVFMLLQLAISVSITNRVTQRCCAVTATLSASASSESATIAFLP